MAARTRILTVCLAILGAWPILMAGTSLVAVSGCAGTALTETQRYEIASNAQASAVQQMTLASNRREISLETFETFMQAAELAHAGLDEWERAIVEGRDFDYIRVVESAIDNLVKSKLEALHHGNR